MVKQWYRLNKAADWTNNRIVEYLGKKLYRLIM